MDNKNLKTQGTSFYQELLESFIQWLERLGYAGDSIKARRRYLKSFLSWLEQNHLHQLEDVGQHHLQQYQSELEKRPNPRGGSLHSRTIQAYISVLSLFDEYLQSYGYAPLVKIRFRLTSFIEVPKTILSREEIKALYQATDQSAYGYRDRAMLAVYYGCGLRSNEGLELLSGDIDFKSSLLQVRKGKYYRQRYVPMSAGVQHDLQEWLTYGRKLINEKSDYLLVHSRGKYKEGKGLNDRLEKLTEQAGISKHITLHSLRHSIATHLLESGMELEQIRQFLGHHSLEVTQRYTHLIHEQL